MSCKNSKVAFEKKNNEYQKEIDMESTFLIFP